MKDLIIMTENPWTHMPIKCCLKASVGPDGPSGGLWQNWSHLLNMMFGHLKSLHYRLTGNLTYKQSQILTLCKLSGTISVDYEDHLENKMCVMSNKRLVFLSGIFLWDIRMYHDTEWWSEGQYTQWGTMPLIFHSSPWKTIWRSC